MKARLDSGTFTGCGLGWMVSLQGTRQLIAHSRGAMGGTTFLLRAPTARSASVIFANVDNVPRLRELAEQLLGARSPSPPGVDSMNPARR